MSELNHEVILQHIRELSANDNQRIKAAQDTLVEAGESALPDLVDVMTGPDPAEIRWRAAETVGRIGSPAVPRLIELTRNSSPLVRRMAIGGLWMTKDRRGIPAIQAVLRDENEQVRHTALRALQELGVPAEPPMSPAPAARTAPVHTPPAPEHTPPAPVHTPPAPVRRPPRKLSPERFADSLRMMGWYFAKGDDYAALSSEENKFLIRQLAALPINVMVWFTLSIPVVASALGVFALYENWPERLALILAVPLGWLIMWLLDRNLKAEGDLSVWAAVAILVALIVVGFVVYTELRFIAITMGSLGRNGGMIVVGTFLMALTIPIAIGLNMRVFMPLLIPGLIGLVIGLYIPALLNMERVYTVVWLACILGGVVFALLPAVLVSLLLMLSPNETTRQTALSVTVLLNIVLIWLLLFDGWQVLYQPFV